jgi:ABC-2 type transport system ATP-binding protein
MDKVLEVKSLTKKYSPTTGVGNVSFNLCKGQILAYLGHNGAGKTTTVRSLLGLMRIDSGEIRYFGRTYNTYNGDFDRVRGEIGVCLDTPGFYPDISAWQNLEFFAGLYGLEGTEFNKRSEELLQEMDLYDSRLNKPKTFSKGMLQKLALIRAILHKPKVLFLDEPTSGLDPAARLLMRNYLGMLAKKNGVAIFLTSHDLNEVEQLADDVIILEKGKIKLQGELSKLKRMQSGYDYIVTIDMSIGEANLKALGEALHVKLIRASEDKVFITGTAALSLDNIIDEFGKQNVKVLEFRKEDTNLEQIYFNSLKQNESAN